MIWIWHYENVAHFNYIDIPLINCTLNYLIIFGLYVIIYLIFQSFYVSSKQNIVLIC